MITHTFANENDGDIEIAGGPTITYTGLEPVTDNLSATDRVFNFTGGTETITLDVSGSDLVIDSTLGEITTFTPPSALSPATPSITINAGTGDDNIIINNVSANYVGNLIVNGDADVDTYTVAGGRITGLNGASGTANLNGELLTGFGTVAASFSGDASSIITATGTGLTIGNLSDTGGFSTQGALNVGSSSVKVLDIGTTTPLGTSTTIASGGLLSRDATSNAAFELLASADFLSGNGTVDGDIRLGRGTVSGNLTVTGTVDGVTNSGQNGLLSPGNSPGVITSTNLTLTGGDTLALEVIGAGTAGTDYDQYSVTNPVTLGGATLELDIASYTVAPGDVITIIDNADGSSGTFGGLDVTGSTETITLYDATGTPVATPETTPLLEGAVIGVNDAFLRLSYSGGSVTLSSVFAEVEFADEETTSVESVAGGPAPTILVSGNLTGVPASERTLVIASPGNTATPTADFNFGTNFIIPGVDHGISASFKLDEFDAAGLPVTPLVDGSSTAVFELINDTLIEGDEQASLTLSFASANALTSGNVDGDIATRAGTFHNIDDDDEIRFTIVDNQSFAEGTSGTIDVLAETSADGGAFGVGNAQILPLGFVSVIFQDSATAPATLPQAISGTDYTAIPATTLTVTSPASPAPGFDGGTLTVPFTAANDVLVEGDEATVTEFNATIASGNGTPALNPVNGQVVLGGTEEVVITDAVDDTATVEFDIASSSVAETGGTLEVDLKLNLTGGATATGQPITINVEDLLTTGAGTALLGAANDYTVDSATVTFPAGSVDGAIVPITLTINNDSLVEGPETVDFSLVGTGTNLPALSGQVTAGSQTTHQVTIT
ncbi:aggregation factor core protein MAFp3, isoform C, partial [Rhodopirellula europaea SH398]